MIDVIREMLSRGLKDSDYLEKAVVTGCLRIAKESVFTGLNHFGCHTISDDSLSDALGITPNEAQITDADCRTIRLYGIAFSGKTCYIVQEIQKPL